MRLTLRTLLAYLDDTLEPGQAKEIGKRAEESPHAKAIVERIRQVVRNPNVIAPSPDSEGIDANDVAEYLDNELDPDQVAELEKKILTSDMNLAETASVHQILSLILSETADVTDYDFKRLYNVHANEKRKQKKREQKQNKSIPPIEPLAMDPMDPAPALMNDLDPVQPFAVQTPRANNNAIAVLAVVFVSIALVAVVWISLIPGERDKKKSAANDRELASAKQDQKAGESVSKPATEKPIVEDKKSPAVKKEDTPPVKTPTLKDGDKKQPEMPKRVEIDSPKVDEKQPQPSTETDAKKEKKTEPAPAVNPSLPIGLVADLGSNGDFPDVLFAKSKENKSRRLMRTKDELFAGETINGTYGFRTTIDLAGQSHFDIIDGTQMVLVSARSDEIAIDHRAGRTVLRCDDLVKVLLTYQSETIVIQIKKPQSRIAWESSTGEPAGEDRSASAWPMRMGFYLIAGEAEISRPNSPTILLTSGQQVELVVGKGLEAVRPTEFPPGWILAGRGSGDQKAAIRFSGLLADKPVEDALRQMTAQSTKEIRKLAVQALATLGADDALLNAVRETKHADVRHAATESIKQSLRDDPRRLPKFQQKLQAYFPGNKGEAIGAMAMGFTSNSYVDPALSERMVKWLEFDDVWVRELAIAGLKSMNEDNDLGYVAEATAPRRKAAVAAWQDWLKDIKRKAAPPPEPKKS